MTSVVETIQKEAQQIEKEAVDGTLPDSTSTSARWLGYLRQVKPLFIASSRYLAYTSDLGEAFRPVVNPTFVTAAYGVSWAYLIGDVGYEGYKAHVKYNSAPQTLQSRPSETTEVGLQVVKRAIFQGLASMLLPALTIHSTVKYSGRYLFKNVKNVKVRGWAPTVMGLAVVPALPFLFDEPVEHATDTVFNAIEQQFGVTSGTHSVREDAIREKKDL